QLLNQLTDTYFAVSGSAEGISVKVIAHRADFGEHRHVGVEEIHDRLQGRENFLNLAQNGAGEFAEEAAQLHVDVFERHLRRRAEICIGGVAVEAPTQV